MLHKGMGAFEAALHHKIIKACSLNPANFLLNHKSSCVILMTIVLN